MMYLAKTTTRCHCERSEAISNPPESPFTKGGLRGIASPEPALSGSEIACHSVLDTESIPSGFPPSAQNDKKRRESQWQKAAGGRGGGELLAER